MTEALQIGQFVELSDGRTATISYLGETAFSSGEWVGVTFDAAEGKNDGSVHGRRYFECGAGHGMFLRPAGIRRVLEEPTPRAKPVVQTQPLVPGARNSVVTNRLRRPSSIDTTAARRQTLNAASPTPGARGRTIGNGSMSPSKLNAKPFGSALASSVTSSRASSPRLSGRLADVPSATTTSSLRTGGYPRNASVGASAGDRPRASQLRPAARQSRMSVFDRSLGRVRHVDVGRSLEEVNGDAGLNGTRHAQQEEDQRSEASAKEDEASSIDEVAQSDGEAELIESGATLADGQAKHGEDTRPSVEAQPMHGLVSTTSQAPATKKQIDILEAKLRAMERKRLEDRAKLKTLEKLQAEKDRFEVIIRHLQAKIQPQQQELEELKRRLKESESRLGEDNTIQADHETDLEMVTLDREMAEETAQVLRTELEALRQKAEELQLEVEVLREENQELGKEISPKEKTSQGWLQLERSNERLKEALLRLREVTQLHEAEMEDQIKSLEHDLKQLEGIKEQYEEAKTNLHQSEIVIEDLRQQLDAALGAEGMLEELTERNLALTEQIDDFKLNIDELESLKKLSDELEQNHIDSERHMQKEIQLRDNLVAEQSRRSAQQEEKLVDYEHTIAQYRKLVASLQSHIGDMRLSQQTTVAEFEELNHRSTALMEMNRKLQGSAVKTSDRTIELDLLRLEAQDAAEHLPIITMFLPDSFKSEQSSIMSYLQLKRSSAKARLLHGMLKNGVSADIGGVPADNVFALCDIMDKLVWIASMCDRLANAAATSSSEGFARFEGVLHDSKPIERAMNTYLTAWKTGDLQEHVMVEELQRCKVLLYHLAESHIEPTNLQSHADEILMSAVMMQSNLENTAIAFSYAKSMVDGKSNTAARTGDHDLLHFTNHSESLVSQTRSAKMIADKALHALKELNSRSLSLNFKTQLTVDLSQACTEQLARATRTLGQYFQDVLEDRDTGADSEHSMLHEAVEILNSSDSVDIPLAQVLSMFNERLAATSQHLTAFLALISDPSQAVQFERSPPPWVLRSEQLKSSKLASISTEEELKRLQEVFQERSTQLKLRNQTVEEQAIKIELLESRMRDASAKASKIAALERLVEDGKTREKKLMATLETQLCELQKAQQERDGLILEAEERKRHADRDESNQYAGRSSAAAKELEALKLEVEGLQGAVRFLRKNDRPARLESQMDWLEQPLLPRRTRANRKTKEEMQKEEALAHGADVFVTLLDMVANAEVMDLTKLPTNKLAWRPAKEKSAWKMLKQRQEWERWRRKRDEAVRKCLEIQGRGVKVRSRVPTEVFHIAPFAGAQTAEETERPTSSKSGGSGDWQDALQSLDAVVAA